MTRLRNCPSPELWRDVRAQSFCEYTYTVALAAAQRGRNKAPSLSRIRNHPYKQLTNPTEKLFFHNHIDSHRKRFLKKKVKIT